MSTLFNESLKDEYLTTISKLSSRENYKRLFIKTFKYEIDLEKDLYDFSLNEIENILYGLESESYNSINASARNISSYLKWCCEKGYSKSNPLQQLNSADFLKYVSNKNKYYSRTEFEVWQKRLNNYHEVVVSELLFHGIGGKGFSEIQNLEISHLNEKRKELHLLYRLQSNRQDTPLLERVIGIEDRTIEIIKKAFREGNNIAQSEFVVREPITKMGDDKLLDPKFIQTSGMIYYAKKFIGDEQLTKDDLKMVAHRFNIPSYHTLKGYITMERINEIYGDKSKSGAVSHQKILNKSDNKFDQKQVNNFELVDEGAFEIQEVTRRKREVPHAFKELMMSIHGKCVVTGETSKYILEGAHIQPYINKDSDHVQNGLLLRVDIHRLFDKGLLSIDEDYVIKISPGLYSEYYQSFHNKKMHLPENTQYYPSKKALAYHIKLFKGEKS